MDLMKFYDITSKHLKHLTLTLLAVFLANDFQAQNMSHSPYSRFGIGDLQPIKTPRNMAMGGLSVGLVSISDLSSRNPASYMNLDSLVVNFEVTMRATFSRLHESGQASTNTNSAALGQISFAFPITSWLKSSFGLTPSSNISYDVTRETVCEDMGRQRLRNFGQGGFNQLFFGAALGTRRISVGANFNYQIGSFTRDVHFSFPDTVLQVPTMTEMHTYLDASGFFFDFGIQYKQPLPNNFQLGFGFTYTPKYILNATRNYHVLSRAINGMIVPIHASDDENGTLQMPDMYAFGLSFERLGRWVIAAEYSVVNFGNYREYGHRDLNLSTSSTFRAGLELKGNRLHNDLFNRMSYRFGFHYGTGYVRHNDREINQFGVSFGFGMPVRRSLSRVDFAIEVGRRGNANIGQIQENYGRIIIGISAFDRWFVRRRFD